MRFLSAVLSVLVVSLAPVPVSVSGTCSGAFFSTVPGDTDFRPLGAATNNAQGGTPSSDALPLFFTRDVVTGNFAIKAGVVGGGLTAADKFCNKEANTATSIVGGAVTATVTKKAGTYRAIISNAQIDAYNRFGKVNPEVVEPEIPGETTLVEHDVVDSNGMCIASSVDQLFTTGYTLTFLLKDQAGTFVVGSGEDSGIPSFTGSTSQGFRWWTDTSAAGPLQAAYCGTAATTGGWNSNSGTTSVGIVYSATADTQNGWLGRGVATGSGDGSPQSLGCGNGFHLLCMAAAPAPTQPGGTGDPQFTGLQGQSFQVHGMPEEFFNLISSPDLQLNSRFAYLASGNCNYNNTECWTHPGTYVDQLGFMFPGLQIKAVAGTHDQGMKVFVNDKRIEATATASEHVVKGTHAHTHGSNHTAAAAQVVSISYRSGDRLVVSSPLFTITATNSDMFFNFGVSLHSPSLLAAGSRRHHIRSGHGASAAYPSFPLHGLLGQTWKNARYANGAFFAGTVDDYMLLDSQLFSNKFVFNQYKH